MIRLGDSYYQDSNLHESAVKFSAEWTISVLQANALKRNIQRGEGSLELSSTVDPWWDAMLLDSMTCSSL